MSKYSKKIIDECKNMYKEGLSLTKIQKLKNLNRKELSRDLKEYGVYIKKNNSIFEEKYLKNQDKIITIYFKEKTITKTQKILKLNPEFVSIILKMNKIIEQPEFENELSDKILKDYREGFSIRDLTKKYSKSANFLIQLLRYKKIDTNKRTNRIYFFKENFFSQINTEEKAYFLGLLYADGYVSSQAYNNNIEITLKEEDKYILEKFAEALKLNKKPKLKKVKLNEKTFNSYRLQFSSKQMHLDLIQLGCFPNKSLNLKFPTEKQVPKYLIHHFMRGYFDGDGTIYYSKNKRIYDFSVLGTKDFLLEYQNKLIKNCNLNLKTKLYKNHNIDSIKYAGKNQVFKIYNFLYKNQNIYLERKHKKFIAVLNGNI